MKMQRQFLVRITSSALVTSRFLPQMLSRHMCTFLALLHLYISLSPGDCSPMQLPYIRLSLKDVMRTAEVNDDKKRERRETFDSDE